MRKKVIYSIVILVLALGTFELILRLLGIGENIVYEELDDLGYRPVPHQSFSTLGTSVTIIRDGMRGPVTNSATLFVGDSVTYGCAFIPDKQTFAARLEGMNAGVNGWGLQNVAALLRKVDLTPYSHVIWTIPTCDVLRPFATLHENTIYSNHSMTFRLQYILRFLMYIVICPELDHRRDDAFDDNLQALQSSYTYCKDKNIELTFIFLPSRTEALGETVRETPFLESMKQTLSNAQIPYFEYSPENRNVADYYYDELHLSEKGHANLSAFIKERNIIASQEIRQ